NMSASAFIVPPTASLVNHARYLLDGHVHLVSYRLYDFLRLIFPETRTIVACHTQNSLLHTLHGLLVNRLDIINELRVILCVVRCVRLRRGLRLGLLVRSGRLRWGLPQTPAYRVSDRS